MGFDNRRFAVAMVLSLLIMVAFQYLVPQPKKPVRPVTPPTAASAPATPGQAPSAALPGIGVEQQTPTADRLDLLKATPRIAIETPLVTGSISLKGGRIDDLTLLKYHETIDPKSPAIVLLSPSGTASAYVGEAGWIARDHALKLPDSDSLWIADQPDTSLGVGKTVSMHWSNGAGLTITRTFSIDAHYMFTISDTVANDGQSPLSVRPYALLSRAGTPPQSTSWISYEGPIGAFNGVEEDVAYKEIVTAGTVERPSTGGWLGFSDKYWLGAVAPAAQDEAVVATFRHAGDGPSQKFQVDYLGADQAVAPGSRIEHATLMYAGPKEVGLLASYRTDLNLPRFDNAVDFGWFWFLTKPIFYLLDWIYGIVGNFGIAILLLTVVMRAIFFPLQTRAVLSMNKMKVLQPAMAKLREQYADDKPRMNQEIAELYKKSGANPVAGCLPILLQIPVFFSLYKVLFVSIEMRHAPFFGWIRDLSAPDPTNLFTLFGVLPFDPPQPFHVGIWPMIYCAAMYTQQRLGPQAPDPMQAKMMQFMPFLFTFMLGNFPVGLVIYWSWSTILVIGQQYLINNHIVGNTAEAKA